MSKFSIAARIVELNRANTGPSSRAVSSAGLEETLLHHFLNSWRSQRAAHLKSVPTARLDTQIIEEKFGEPAKQQASPYDLASNNPYVIAATLFSRKR